MPSVDTHWSGQCPDPNIQENLCHKLRTIAELSHSYFKDQEPIKYFDREITGNILIDSSLVGKGLKCNIIKKVVHRYTDKRLDFKTRKLLAEILGVSSKPERKREVFYSINKAYLYGLEFLLFDPRGRDVDDRISFVFLRIDDCDELKGKLVLVENQEECQKYYNKKIQESDWYLTSPRLHLRYFCEKWVDRLMYWVKYFYIPNLHYWRYDDFPGYEEFSHSIDHTNLEEFDLEKISRRMIVSLRSELREEIQNWIERWGVPKKDENQE